MFLKMVTVIHCSKELKMGTYEEKLWKCKVSSFNYCLIVSLFQLWGPLL